MEDREDIRVELRADPRWLIAIRGLVRGYFERAGIAPDRADQAVLAVDEACTNAIRHSYANQPNGTILLSLHQDGEGVAVRLRDTGCTADPCKVGPRSAACSQVDSLEPGGLGVAFIRQAFDVVEYARGPAGGNCVTMRLRASAQESPDGVS